MRSSKEAGDVRWPHEIGAAVLEVVATEGLESVSPARIARALGVPSTTLMNSCPAEDDLWRAAAAVIEERIVSTWQTSIEVEQPPVERLVRLLRAQVRLIASAPALGEILLGKVMLSTSPVIAQALNDMRARFSELVVATLREGVQAGQFAAGTDADAMAHELRVRMQGAVVSWRLGLRGLDFARNLEDELQDLIFGQYMEQAPSREPYG